MSMVFLRSLTTTWAARLVAAFDASGVHLLVQTRVRTLLQELGAVFHQWYPALQREAGPLAACPPAS
jgi:hypothetical protein